MDYVLTSPPASKVKAGRIVPPRSRNLRRGGGRKDTPGWTEHKLRMSRRRFHQLRSYIMTGVTVCYPRSATTEQLKALSCCIRDFCREKGIPARAVWEGPGKHQHIALGIEHSDALEHTWIKRLKKRWRKVFDTEMPPKAFYWNPLVKPDQIASYLSKTRSNGQVVKGSWPWMCFNPVWETGFSRIIKAAQKPKKTFM